MMKRKHITLFLMTLPLLALIGCNASGSGTENETDGTVAEAVVTAPAQEGPSQAETFEDEPGKPIYLNTADFLARVHDFRSSSDWKYEGDKPAIIDFYADWCQPCKMVAPYLEELAAKYDGQVYIYKVNVDKETDLAAFYQIRSIPTFFFIKADGSAVADMGLKPKEYFEQQIISMLD